MRFLFIVFILISIPVFAQTNAEIAIDKGMNAIKLMDEGKLDESIALLKESEQLDPDNFIYPYEIAYAYYLKGDYQSAIEIVERVKDYKNANFQLYQMWGNLLDLTDKKDEAIKKYDEGLAKYPDKGPLYLERGVVLESQGKNNDALVGYLKGIDVNPEYASNYYRAANLFLASNNKVPGLILGEIFLNMERTTDRSIEMSENLYNAYKNAIRFEKEEVELDFCDAVIDAGKFEKDKRLPFCMIFGKNFIQATVGINEFNLDNLVVIRNRFLTSYFQNDYKEYPDFLLNYLKKVDDEEHFTAYNYYLFQIGAEDEFKKWLGNHREKYDDFADWYTLTENIINPTKEDHYQYEY